MEADRGDDRLRVAELMAALSLVADLGTGQPAERQLGVCLAALQLADRVGCGAAERSDVLYLSLLAHLGCTTVAPYVAELAGGDDIRFQRDAQVLGPASQPAEDLRHLLRRLGDDRPLPERARLLARLAAGGRQRFEAMASEVCEGASLLAERLGMAGTVVAALGQLTERWDGTGLPRAAAGDEISRALRVVRVAHDLVALAGHRGLNAARASLLRRRGRGYDPAVVDAALADPRSLLRAAQLPDAWQRVLEAEPEPVAVVGRAGVGRVARAFGEFADMKVGFLRGHSARVAELAATAAAALSCSRDAVAQVREAGLLHDVGRVAVPNGVWDTPGPLSTGERERVRLHAYYTERVLGRAEALAGIASLAGSHHERLDGSGYHRGATAAQLDVRARVLAAADVFDAMVHDRPHRPALSPREARSQLADAVRGGELDKRAVDAVLQAAGTTRLEVRQGYPAGLSEREVEVLRLIAQGRTSREIAEALVITEKTARHHVEHIYAKARVSTRVGATLFAMRHGLAD